MLVCGRLVCEWSRHLVSPPDCLCQTNHKPPAKSFREPANCFKKQPSLCACFHRLIFALFRGLSRFFAIIFKGGGASASQNRLIAYSIKALCLLRFPLFKVCF